ncbi:MAG: hypothetical protein Q7R87_01055 [Nanoarchaeota archaeon]|nr:hypothetical protein [Nanoarchaeota archaeon]
MNDRGAGVSRAANALNFIIPLLRKYNFNWIITGGFASYVHGVNRPITDIDIDIEISKKDKKFKKLLSDIKPFISQKLIHFVDKNYNNYNLEIDYNGQVIDICSSKELKIFNKKSGKYEQFYNLLGGFPKPKFMKFQGLKLPLLSKKLIIKNKEMLVWQRESDFNDIKELKKL